jgi:predicted O-methyltransferase YrrM
VSADRTRLRKLLGDARRFARRRASEFRQRFGRAREGLLAVQDERYLVVLDEKFMHDRSSLQPLIDRITNRGVMVEVGSLAGFSTRLFARHFEKVFSVDPYEAGYDDTNDKNSNAVRLGLARDLFTLRFIDEPRVVQYQERSAAGCRRFEDRSLDFVYLDGSHTYEAVAEDIRCWHPKVKPGGMIGGDDFAWEGVARAVREALDRFEVIENRWLAIV